ncbi:MAG: hypothetical protein ACPGUV_00405, partial [Polyangiales bacterium]
VNAYRAGTSLSAWIRQAALRVLKEQERSQPLHDPAVLEAFFAACDACADDLDHEPNWDSHKRVLRASRVGKLPTAELLSAARQSDTQDL